MFVSESASKKQLGACLASSGRRWWWPRQPQPPQPLASFPLSSALTAANIMLQEPRSGGGGYAWMHSRGLVDDRTVIMAHLVAERLKGQASKLAPWIDALPKT